VVINHNYAEFLNAAIDSALTQSTPAAQVVVVDDGSTDASRALIARYGGRIVPVLKAAGGHVTAVNAGYAVATGDLCIFLDADDVLYSQCVEAVLKAWRPGDVKLQYRLDTIDQEGVNQRMPFPHFPKDLTPEAVRAQSFRNGVYPWTVSSGNAFSRALLDALLPIDPEEIYRSPDGYINKMAPLFGDVRSISDILGAYRVHGANAWAQVGSGLRLEPIVRWLKFDRVLHKEFQQEAAKRGIEVTQLDEVNTLQQAEYRLLAFRFAPEQFAQPMETASSLFNRGVKAAKAAPNTSPPGRIFWTIWLFVIAFLPKVIVRAVFGAARGQTGRSLPSRLLVQLSRGSSS
jgi:glycosyltransferase involved in cell wall biosynthesis